MTKSRTTRPAALALAVLMAAALGACCKSEQDQAARQVDQAAASLLQGAQAVHGVADRLGEGSRSLAQNTAHFHLQ